MITFFIIWAIGSVLTSIGVIYYLYNNGTDLSIDDILLSIVGSILFWELIVIFSIYNYLEERYDLTNKVINFFTKTRIKGKIK